MAPFYRLFALALLACPARAQQAIPEDPFTERYGKGKIQGSHGHGEAQPKESTQPKLPEPLPMGKLRRDPAAPTPPLPAERHAPKERSAPPAEFDQSGRRIDLRPAPEAGHQTADGDHGSVDERGRGGRATETPDGPSRSSAATRAAASKESFYSRAFSEISALPSRDAAPRQLEAEEALRQAKLLFRGGDPKSALAEIGRALKLDPNNARALLRQAEALNALGRHNEAVASGAEAVKLAPESAAAWSELAWSRFKAGDHAGAIEAASRALTLDSGDAMAYAIRARARWAMGDKEGALRDARSAAELDGRFAQLYDAMRSGTYADEERLTDVGGAMTRRWPWAPGLLLLLAAAAAAGRYLRRRPVPKRSAPSPLIEGDAKGLVAGKYELQRVLGRGGMGEVYEAKDHTLNRQVAVKRVTGDITGERGRALFVKEARTVAGLHHPNIVDIYEIFESGEEVYLVFELVRGKTFSQVLADRGPLPLEEAARLIRPVCQALQFAHGRNLVHRDIKPANLMLTHDGYVKIMDFGIARSIGAAPPTAGAPVTPGTLSAQTRTVMGTPRYMAPEMELGRVSKEGDVYALGVTLYELLTGRPPFDTMAQKTDFDVKPPSAHVTGLPPAVDAVVLSALQPDPAKRLRSAGQFFTQLYAAVKPERTPT